jgi:hypothetical protein
MHQVNLLNFNVFFSVFASIIQLFLVEESLVLKDLVLPMNLMMGI